MAERVGELAERGTALGCTVALACGFALCAFSDQALGRVRRAGGVGGFGCAFAGCALPGRRVALCERLADHPTAGLEPGASLAEVAAALAEASGLVDVRDDQALVPRRRFGFERCTECTYAHRALCGDGCVARCVGPASGIAPQALGAAGARRGGNGCAGRRPAEAGNTEAPTGPDAHESRGAPVTQ
jgi:hypothetical protein